LAGDRSLALGIHSYVVVAAAMMVSLAATFRWWQYADHHT
jgi:hypothetical protein